MSDEASALGRHEAHRQALSGVIARFTADRDSLLAAVQSCQERVTELVQRLGAEPASPVSGGSALEALTVRVAVLEACVEALGSELRALRGSADRR